jgi:hypothetical protein
MADDFKYDVFLSYSSKDVEVVRAVAERLRADGMHVWFDGWELGPGDNIPSKIEDGLEHSRVLVLCMSTNAFGSEWAQLEAGTFRFRDPLNKELRFIPLRLDAAPIKGLLAQFLFINWLPEVREQEYAKLLEACRSTAKRPVSATLLTEESSPIGAKSSSHEKIHVYRLQLKARYAEVTTIDPTRHLDLSKDLIPLKVISAAIEQILRDSMDDADAVLDKQVRREQAWEKQQIFEREAESIASILKRHRRLIILGDAGTGKTTLLYSLLYANACATDRGKGYVPFFASLAQYNLTQSKSLLSFVTDFLEQQHQIANAKEWIAEIFGEGRGMLLLDGLDEMRTPGERKRVADDLLALSSADFHDQNIVCITSRVAGFRNWFPGFKLVAVSEVSREQALQFVRVFVEDDEQAQLIADVIESNPLEEYAGMTPLRRIVRTPLFLAVLTLVLKRSSTKRLPSRRVDVYNRCIEVLLWEWLEHKGLEQQDVDYDVLLRVMCSAALQLQHDGTRLFSRGDLQKNIASIRSNPPAFSESADSLVRAVTNARGIITKCAHDLYQFYHLTFQEYLCARALTSSQEGLADLLKHARDPKWEEVVKMYAALQENPREICGLLLEHGGVLLCAKALEEMATPIECLRFVLHFCISRHGTTSSLGEDWDVGNLEYLEDAGLMTDSEPEQIRNFEITEARLWISRVLQFAEIDSLRAGALDLAEHLGEVERARLVSEWRARRGSI